ncbi:hypothetical protein ILFOPFJJ_06425 [Ensifer psoraleae]|nr:hypothetical protein [Sinorhizobium psoraleae]
MGLGREEEVEIHNPPRFMPGEKVCATRHIKNDGTYPGKEIGERLVRKGDAGFVRDVGTFLQQFYIYAVEWIDRGNVVGMRARELRSLDEVSTLATAECTDRSEGNAKMKVTIRRTGNDLSAYVAKKDLEEPIVEVENEGLWGGFVVLRNGWRLLLPDLPQDTQLPVTVEAKKVVNDAAQRKTP